MIKPKDLLCPAPAGLYCPPGDFYIDPVRPVSHAIITHGHADHARSGHGTAAATAETLAIMAARYGEDFAQSGQAIAYGEKVERGGVEITLVPAGHILGSAQVVLRWRSEEHTSELQSHVNLVCRLLLEKKKKTTINI